MATTRPGTQPRQTLIHPPIVSRLNTLDSQVGKICATDAGPERGDGAHRPLVIPRPELLSVCAITGRPTGRDRAGILPIPLAILADTESPCTKSAKICMWYTPPSRASPA